ncbi:hypothetical protein [Halomonas huangheensis]|uniref:Uncharacterized protein n=1 Tax=Halomonas huangheensis TaxID=1178482 RepID=W1N566_9GAMM|nr:hypothetical protein [Halomonas huangheensis]ALM52151.1 hypothetical protein AR456_07530 [Halomonas huangheensis]ERL50717.1 hypothetical protein BJB45_06175 [Halomonas huangheensis]
MSAAHSDNPYHTDCRPRRVNTRWWLAGLLVGCLLPAGLIQAESPRATQRLVQICIMAPAMIRARTVLKACRRQLTSHPAITALRHPATAPAVLSPVLRAVAALDVVSRRGPPSPA